MAADDGSLHLERHHPLRRHRRRLRLSDPRYPAQPGLLSGLEYLISKNSNKSITSFAPNGLSQSRIGIKGTEEIADGWSGMFNTEMGFDPQSGNLSDALKALTHNNGVPLNEQTSAADSCRAGQFFSGQVYLGIDSKDAGTLTFGRQNSLLLDNINNYDPMGGSYAFSVIGHSGTTAGMGDTEDATPGRFDQVRPQVRHVPRRPAVSVRTHRQQPGRSMAGQSRLRRRRVFRRRRLRTQEGRDLGHSLSSSQILTLPANSLSATISDNTSYTFNASYSFRPAKLFPGYEHIKYKNPSVPLVAPFHGLGGYDFSVVNNAAYTETKKLGIYWVGGRYFVHAGLGSDRRLVPHRPEQLQGNGCSDDSSPPAAAAKTRIR